jgi:hypothetical protein
VVILDLKTVGALWMGLRWLVVGRSEPVAEVHCPLFSVENRVSNVDELEPM